MMQEKHSEILPKDVPLPADAFAPIKAAPKPLIVSLQWMAGYCDGEGSIGITQQGTSFRGRVRITNTDLYTLECVQETFGGTISIHGRGTNRIKPSWQWSLNGIRARGLLGKLYRFLITKRRQAKCLIEFYDYKDVTKHPSYQTLYQYKRRMTTLNKRGAKILRNIGRDDLDEAEEARTPAASIPADLASVS